MALTKRPRDCSDLRGSALGFRILLCAAACWFLAMPGIADANNTDPSPEQFVSDAFNGERVQPSMLWLDAEQRLQAERILTHPLGLLRVRYWRRDLSTAWILDEIGKTEPITIGVLVRDGALAQIRVLVYRESRGDEVRHDFFTRQFLGARLKPGSADLTSNIDGITGATLSVNAMRRVARLALYFNALVVGDGANVGQ